MRYACGLAMSLIIAAPALAEGFAPLRERDAFVAQVADRELRRFGIRLNVTPTGKIAGRAFGRPVSGAWRWREGYFCRSLSWGQQELEPNCQEVKVQGERVRFVSDRGAGQYAEFQLR